VGEKREGGAAALLLLVPCAHLHPSKCYGASASSLPRVGLTDVVSLSLLLSTGYLDVKFSHIMALKCKPATTFGVLLNKQEFASILGEKLSRFNLGIRVFVRDSFFFFFFLKILFI